MSRYACLCKHTPSAPSPLCKVSGLWRANFGKSAGARLNRTRACMFRLVSVPSALASPAIQSCSSATVCLEINEAICSLIPNSEGLSQLFDGAVTSSFSPLPSPNLHRCQTLHSLLPNTFACNRHAHNDENMKRGEMGQFLVDFSRYCNGCKLVSAQRICLAYLSG